MSWAPPVQLTLGLDAEEPPEGPILGPEQPLEPRFPSRDMPPSEPPSVAPPEKPAAAAPPPPPPPPPPTAPPPNVGPPEDGEADLDKFPEWAGGMLLLGDNTDPTKVPLTAEDIRSIRALVVGGPNATALNQAERDALTYAIAWQYNRVRRAAQRREANGEMTPWATAQLVDEARRYAALRALATVPMDQWGPLEKVWASGPVSQGEGGTLEDFLERRRAAEAAGDTAALADLQAEAAQRLGIMLSDSESRVVGRRMRRAAARVTGGNVAADDANRARKYGKTLAEGVNSAFATPDRVAALASDADLRIHPWEVLQNARYNGVLFGARGIGIDYLTDFGMLFGKMFVDPFLPSQGGTSLQARAVITAVEYAALKRAIPLMLRRMGEVFFTGVSHTEADVSGVPRTVSGKLGRRIQDRQSELGLQGRRRIGGKRVGFDLPIDPQTGSARANLDPKLNALRLAKATSVGFLELAGRLKAMADVAVKELAYGMDMTRQAAIMAWREKLRVDSPEWHARVAEILQGNINPRARTKEEKQAATAVYQDMQNKAKREAERTTFQGEMGTVGRMMEPIHKHPLGQYVLMFLRTLYHIRGLGIDVTPLGLAATVGDVTRSGVHRGLMRSERGQRFLGKTRNVGGLLGGPYQVAWSGDQVGKGVSDLDRRLVTNMAGSLAFFYVMGLAFEGMLSGSGPPDDPIVWLEDSAPNFDKIALRKAMQEEGWQPYSIKINGTWHSYQNWGPLAYMFAAAAAIGEGYKYGVRSRSSAQQVGRRGVLWPAHKDSATLSLRVTRRRSRTLAIVSSPWPRTSPTCAGWSTWPSWPSPRTQGTARSTRASSRPTRSNGSARPTRASPPTRRTSPPRTCRLAPSTTRSPRPRIPTCGRPSTAASARPSPPASPIWAQVRTCPGPCLACWPRIWGANRPAPGPAAAHRHHGQAGREPVPGHLECAAAAGLEGDHGQRDQPRPGGSRPWPTEPAQRGAVLPAWRQDRRLAAGATGRSPGDGSLDRPPGQRAGRQADERDA